MISISTENKRLIAWLQISLILFLFVAATVIAPISSFFHATRLADSLYMVFGFICHQMPERSFWIFDSPLAVCARCFGIYLGLFVGATLVPLTIGLSTHKSLSPFWILLALIPMTIDWSLTFFEIWENTGFSRLVTGGLVGIACGISITKSLIELRSS